MGKPESLVQARSRDDAAQLWLIVENMPAMSIAYDKTLRCQFANRRFCEFFGLAAETVVGKHLRDIIGEGPYREVKPCFELVLEGRRATYRRTHVVEGGEPRYLEVNLVPHIAEDGRTLGLVAIATDVTEGKGPEAALRAQEEFFRLIAENIGDFIAVLDLEGRRLYNSPSYRRLFGGATELQGTNSFAEVHPDDRERVKRVFRTTVQSGIGHHLEYRFMSENGEIRHMESRGGVIRDNEGRVARVVVVSHDITERKQAEEALRESAEKLRVFADNVPAMTASFDENLRCLFANKLFAEFYGVAVEAIVGKHLREIVGDEAYGVIESHFAQALRGHPVTYERTRKLASGESRYIEVKLLPHVGDQGKVLGCFVVKADITEHRLAAERIQRTAHHDSLTGLPNRLLFNDRLDQATSLAKRESRQFALLFLDLDRFKPVNDALGHAAGDALLQGVAARIRRQVRDSDTVARIGGDEFTVILHDVAKGEEAEIVARKIIAALAAPFHLGSGKRSVKIGASIGIAVYPADGCDADALIKASDAAMYRAKQEGCSFRFCTG